ncbi:hypothetical protein J7373_03790 [Xanthomonas sp. A2111]|uniref:DUF4064 domain-containing protein n=1 Tax=Xanthomonas hawaiiensis TaxID=3003247 RepID=A0ABU2I8U9_9XANT|nr:hypothetical protein [Xanthomonas sp. A2111]MBO9827366.1 hypothetical protein [Xanthomonas sp. A2111]MDS9994546.1 hypothetical protein [Xanthomonas sp. A2111]
MSLPPPLPAPGRPDTEVARAGFDLNTLSTLYGVMAGMQIVVMLLVAAVLAYGVHEEARLNALGQSPDEAQGGVVAIAMLSFLLGFGLLSLVLDILVAQALRQRRRLGLCYAGAVITCFGFPLGTALGIATLLTLQRPAVGALFRSPAR